MISKVKILDCTLRDGGYYTNWDFNEDVIQNYFKAMNALPIEYVEIGYRNLRSSTYFGEFYYCPSYTMKKARYAMPNKKLSIMLDEKKTTPEQLQPLLNPCVGFIDMVRIAVAPERLEYALELSQIISEMGFNIGLNVMYMSKWLSLNGFFDRISNIDKCVKYLNIVDSYGGVQPKDIKKIIERIKEKTDTIIGFHGHNNMELSLINSITALECGAQIIDSTINGMGRGAGNLKTELLLTWLSSIGLQNNNFNLISETISDFHALKDQYKWGTSLPYMISGAYSLPQKDVMEWTTVRFYSLDSIVRSLTNIKDNQADNLKLPIFNNKNQTFIRAIVIGGGRNAVLHSDAVKEYILQNQDKTCVIYASTKNSACYYKLSVPQYFCLVGIEGNRFEKVVKDLSLIKGECVLPPYPRKMGTYIPEKMVSQSYELKNITFTDLYKDSHFALALQVCLELNVKDISLVGFDGYRGNSVGEKEKKLIVENEYLIKMFSKIMPLKSLTATEYRGIQTDSLFAYLK